MLSNSKKMLKMKSKEYLKRLFKKKQTKKTQLDKESMKRWTNKNKRKVKGLENNKKKRKKEERKKKKESLNRNNPLLKKKIKWLNLNLPLRESHLSRLLLITLMMTLSQQ